MRALWREIVRFFKLLRTRRELKRLLNNVLTSEEQWAKEHRNWPDRPRTHEQLKLDRSELIRAICTDHEEHAAQVAQREAEGLDLEELAS